MNSAFIRSRSETLSYSPELMMSGHVGCPGCGAAIAMKWALKALGNKTVLVVPACCWAVVSGPHPQMSLKVPVLHTAFETAGAAATGVRAALDMKNVRKSTSMSPVLGDETSRPKF